MLWRQGVICTYSPNNDRGFEGGDTTNQEYNKRNMGLIVDFTKHFWPDYMCKVKTCHNHIYNDIDRVQHQGYCRGCHHKEWLKQEEVKWDD